MIEFEVQGTKDQLQQGSRRLPLSYMIFVRIVESMFINLDFDLYLSNKIGYISMASTNIHG